jgi:hypothetical protein
MNDHEDARHKHQWRFDIGKQILSFVAGIIVAAFILGRNSQKINDVVLWKSQVAPLIEHMNRSGTVSFEHFNASYAKDQARVDERLKLLETEMKDLQKRIDP